MGEVKTTVGKESELAVYDWTAFCTITKAVTDEKSGDRVICGPIASLNEDYDGETVEQSGVMKGLARYEALGAPVDWDHMFFQTHDPNVVVGRGEVFMHEGRPWLRTYLRNTELAKGIWDAVNDPNAPRMGYSIEGGGTRAGKRIINTNIHMITISYLAKGFDQKVFPGAEPQLGISAVCKALVTGKPLPGHIRSGRQVGVDYSTPVTERVGKAFTTGSGIVREGETGGSALRSQYLEGADKKKSRAKRLAATYDDPAVPAKLAKALEAHGITNQRLQVAIARRIQSRAASR